MSTIVDGNIATMNITQEQVDMVKNQALGLIQNKYLQFKADHLSAVATNQTKRAAELEARMAETVTSYQAISEGM
jgi:hypothetical protein